MLLRENATDERLRGSYYTPQNIARYIVRWVRVNNEIKKVLEPSCGAGVFLQCINDISNEDNYNIMGIEIDEEAANLSCALINGSKMFYNCEEFVKEQKQILKSPKDLKQGLVCNIINDDFYKVYENGLKYEKFQAIVGNPPYIRYQYLTDEQREEQSSILISNGMKSNKLINAWVSFIVACVEMLDNDGKIGLVIPAELLQVGYAEDLRMFLMNNLQKTTIVTFRELVFPNVEQEVVLLLGEKDSQHNDEHKLRIVQYNNVEELMENDTINNVEFNNVEINDSKWTRYFLTNLQNELISSIKADNRFIKFGDVASVDIGITTGNNDYFCVNNKCVERFDLINISKPLIARSVNINGIKFTENDWEENVNRGAKTYLLDFPDIPYEQYSDGQKEYICYGEETEQNKGYKCSIRNRWYRIPSIWIPDAFFLRRNHLYPKFVLNSEVGAVSTDTMHRIRFRNGINPKRMLLSYYNSIGLAFTEIEGRSYGGGVLEILPGEVERIILPDLGDENLLNEELVNELVDVIDNYVRTNDDIEGILNFIDRRLLIEILGLDEGIIKQFRNMWLTLRERRLNRRRNR